MVAITKPVPCKKCGKMMENYSMNLTTNKIDFRCNKCRKIFPMSEDQYKQFLRNWKV